MNKVSLQNLLSNPNTYLKVLYIVPVTLTLGLIYCLGVDVPFWDDWSLIKLFESTHSGTLNLDVLFSQHNEHRMFFPSLIILGLAYASKWNLKVQMLGNFFLSIANFFLILKIASITTTSYKTENLNSISLTIINAFSSFLVFSITQWENWLWGFQIAWFLIVTCLLLSTYILVIPTISPLPKILISGTLCFIASFSSAHGLITWVALVPTIIMVCGNLRSSLKILLFWFLLLILTSLLYFHSYSKPEHHPELSFFLDKPLIFFHYLVSIFGSPFPKNPILLGSVIIIICAGMVSYYFWEFLKNRNQVSKSNFLLSSTPWVSIALFSVGFGFITSLGRSGFGVVEQALSPRYASIMVLIYISSMYLLYIFFLEKKKLGLVRSKNFYFSSGILLGLSLSLFISSFYTSSQQALAAAQNSYKSRYEGKLCLKFAKYIDRNNNIDCLISLYPDLDFIKSGISVMEKLRFFDFADNSSFLTYTEAQQLQSGEAYGFIDSPQVDSNIVVDGDGDNSSIIVQGWARVSSLYQSDIYPNIVLFSLNDEHKFFDMTHVGLERKDVAKALNAEKYRFSGWSIDLNFNDFPKGKNKVTAWIYDQSRNVFLPLNNQPIISIN